MALRGRPPTSRLSSPTSRCAHAASALRQLAAPPLAVRALTERQCATMLMELAAMTDLDRATAERRYPVAWAPGIQASGTAPTALTCEACE